LLQGVDAMASIGVTELFIVLYPLVVVPLIILFLEKWSLRGTNRG